MTETVSYKNETVRNGIDTATLFGTLDAIKAQPEIAQFQFRASNTWIDGAHNRSTIKGFYAACAEDTSRTESFTLDAGEPAILLGTDQGPNPAEYLLHALAACVTTSLVFSAAARGVRLTSVTSELEGDLDVQGAMGVNTQDHRNGFERIRMTVTISGDASPEKLREVVERGRDRSVVFDSISNGVPIDIAVVTA
ncbi:OsmC family protein [Pseudonocardia pini]|uniref:OsmC family protein n=1 Tax=Pseudonocardia pini TaxID=2758030 RepID=UPI0015F10E6A|nr:OsmC family protein [Pseudonocardia pini]